MFASRSPKSYQKFLIGSSTINQSSSKGNQHSNDYSFINFNDLYRLHPNLRSVIIVSLKSHQRITTEEAMKHQWFRSWHNNNNKGQESFHRIYQCFKYFSWKRHQRIIDVAAMKHQCFGYSHNKRTFFNILCVEIIEVSSTFIHRIINND